MNFITELIARFISKTPKFFKIMRAISIAIAVITGLPAFLAQSGVDLPASVDAIANSIVSIAAVVGAFIAQLTATIEEKQAKGISD